MGMDQHSCQSWWSLHRGQRLWFIAATSRTVGALLPASPSARARAVAYIRQCAWPGADQMSVAAPTTKLTAWAVEGPGIGSTHTMDSPRRRTMGDGADRSDGAPACLHRTVHRRAGPAFAVGKGRSCRGSRGTFPLAIALIFPAMIGARRRSDWQRLPVAAAGRHDPGNPDQSRCSQIASKERMGSRATGMGQTAEEGIEAPGMSQECTGRFF